MSNIYHAPYRVTQPYGPPTEQYPMLLEPAYGGYAHFHRGLDMVGPSNTCPIYAAVPGVVFSCGTDTDGAVYVIEKADTGHYIAYWHLSKITCTKGQRIDNTTQIGNQGSSGNSTGFHCHAEVEAPGPWLGLLKMTPVDPTPFLADQGAPANQVTDIQDFQNVFITQAQRWANESEVKAWQDSKLPPYQWVQTYGHNPMKEWVEQLQAQVKTLQASLQDLTATAKVDVFKQAYLTRAGQYPTKDQITDWQASDMDAATWVNAHAVSKTETDLQHQLDAQTKTIGDLQTTTQQELKVKDLTISRLEDQLAGKATQEPVEPTPVDNGGIVFSPTPEPTKKSGSFIGWLVDIIKTILNFGGHK